MKSKVQKRKEALERIQKKIDHIRSLPDDIRNAHMLAHYKAEKFFIERKDS